MYIYIYMSHHREVHSRQLSLVFPGGEFGDWGVQGTWRAHGPDMNGLGAMSDGWDESR